MKWAGRDEPAERSGLRSGAVPVLFCALAILLAHHPMILSRMRLIQSDPGDTRLNNYFLEHSYRWVCRASLHSKFWDAPFFHPSPNTMAYSDTLLTLAPLYWPWRAVGFEPDTSMQLWMICLTLVNWATFYLLLRIHFRTGLLPSAIASVLFSAGNSRLAQLEHQQTFSHVFVVLVLFSVLSLFRQHRAEASAAARGGALRVLALCSLSFGVVAQLYAGFYNGFFLVLALATALLVGLAIPALRGQILATAKASWKPASLCAVAVALMLAPLVWHYWAAARGVGLRPLEEVETMLPRVQSWFFMGSGNLWYGKLAGWSIFRRLPMRHEHAIGLGLLSTTVAVSGFVMGRKRRSLQLIAAVTILLALLATRWGTHAGTPLSLWLPVYRFMPAGTAIRAVSRIGILLLIPAGIGLAHFADAARTARWRTLALIVAGLCVVEQVQLGPSYDKAQARGRVLAIAQSVDPRLEAFYVASAAELDAFELTLLHLDAMWAGLHRNAATVNGFSGHVPPHFGHLWTMDFKDDSGPVGAAAIALEGWSARFGVKGSDIQLIVLGEEED